MHDVPIEASASGLGAENRARLGELHRSLPGPFTADEAAKALGVDRSEAAALMTYLARKGWLSRIRRGLFTVVPLEASKPDDWRADPWLVAARVFDPCYIGGWSACEHWGMTEQLFRSTVVVTSRPQRSSHVTIQGAEYRVAVRRPEALFGTRPVWRGRERVAVSDPSKTIVDLLHDPEIGGGIRHLADVLAEYLDGEHRDDGLLVAHGDQLGNRTIFKRLGYLIEALELDAPVLVEACRSRRSAGISKLDPSIGPGGRITKRWGIRANAVLERAATR